MGAFPETLAQISTSRAPKRPNSTLVGFVAADLDSYKPVIDICIQYVNIVSNI